MRTYALTKGIDALGSTVLDWEIETLHRDGVPRFRLLQWRRKRPTAPVVFYLSDLLWSDGRDITGKTVLQRRDRLEQIISPEGVGTGS
jgi:ATP-dependent DNA ligase